VGSGQSVTKIRNRKCIDSGPKSSDDLDGADRTLRVVRCGAIPDYARMIFSAKACRGVGFRELTTIFELGAQFRLRTPLRTRLTWSTWNLNRHWSTEQPIATVTRGDLTKRKNWNNRRRQIATARANVLSFVTPGDWQ